MDRSEGFPINTTHDAPHRPNTLLECLVILSKLHHRPHSAESLIADLPTEPGRATPKLFSLDEKASKSLFTRTARRAGFDSRLVRYRLKEISPLLLPVILMLNNEEACILTELDAAMTRAKIILPEVGEGARWIDLEDLEAEYLGYAFLLQPLHHYTDVRKKVLKHEEKHWFWDTLRYSKTIYADVVVASFLINLFILASPLFTMNVYDRVVPNNAVDTMWVLAIGVIVVYCFDLLLKLLRAYFLENAAKKSDIIMSSLLFEQVMNLKMAVRPRSVGSFANNLKDFESIRSFFTSSTLSALIDLPFTLIFLLVVYIIGGWLVWVPLTGAGIILLYSFVVEKPLRQSVESTYEAAAHKNAILIESLTAIETIKALGLGGHAQWKWEESTGDIANKGLRSRILSNSITSFVNFMVQLNTVALIIGGVYAIQERDLSMGGLIAVVMLGSRMLAPMGQVASLIANYEHTKTAYKVLDDLMELPVERKDGKKFLQRPTLEGSIEFKNVTFSYPGSEKPALDDVSFRIAPGEKVGIIGTNGSGKSTVEKLLLGLYAPDSGSILIDGIDINQIDPADLRRNISYVPQEILLFEGTVKDNITARKPDATDEEVIRAAAMGGVTHFVNTHPLGFDMPVQERGEGLSGGQRQAIGVARAFISIAPVILMDEPSNAMDSSNEARLIAALGALPPESTMIMVSHKQPLLNLTQRLILLDNGRLLLDDRRETVIGKLRGGKETA